MKSPRFHQTFRKPEEKFEPMIFPLAGMLFGAIFGAYRAKSKGGKGKDMAQWAIVFAIIFGLVGLFALIFIERSFY